MTLTLGRLCVKIAGRDAGKKCIVIDNIDNHYVLIDGETRRRKCNILHLEPLADMIDIPQNASHEEVSAVFQSMGISLPQKQVKEQVEKPVKSRDKKKDAIPTTPKGKEKAEKKPKAKKESKKK